MTNSRKHSGWWTWWFKWWILLAATILIVMIFSEPPQLWFWLVAFIALILYSLERAFNA
ncbi:hypothetical protein AB0758_48580 [Tolypothrix bouteillei VB521301_2]|uniref:hypothetical protein n=1 Tax=Tolypothrix bouteillei TaxID=1246981 RepID=UPI000A94AC64